VTKNELKGLQVGDQVSIVSITNTEQHYGCNSQMIRMQDEGMWRVQEINVNRGLVRLNNWNWKASDLKLTKALTKAEKLRMLRLKEIGSTFPEKIPKYIKSGKKLRSFTAGNHNNHYIVYHTDEYPDKDQTAFDDITTKKVRSTGRSCLGSIPENIAYFKDYYEKLPNRVMYLFTLHNLALSKKEAMNKEEVIRWIRLCKQYNMVPMYVSTKRILEKQEVVLDLTKHDIDHLFFHLVNIRYIDEQPQIPKLIMHYLDNAKVDFHIAYVLGHFSSLSYDEEHSALPWYPMYNKKITSNKIRYEDDDWGETYYHYDYKPPSPRDVVAWAIRVYRFTNHINTKDLGPIIDDKFWHLHTPIERTLDDQDVPLIVNNKTFNILKTIDPKTIKIKENK
jgi:hypothetical protein